MAGFQYYNPFQAYGLNNYQPMSQPMTPPATPQPTTSSNPIWVQGEAGAKSYLIAPGMSQMLFDSEAQVFYLKSADASGMPQPLRVFDYTERTAGAQAGLNPDKNMVEKYVTRQEYEDLRNEYAALRKAVSDMQKTEVIDNV